jgi:hypothetical protein
VGSVAKPSSPSGLRKVGQVLRWAAFGDLRRPPRDSAAAAAPPGSPAATGAAAPAANTAPGTDDQRLLAALAGVLDTDSRSRRVFPHLAAVEQSLRRQGADALQELPIKVIDRALGQLESLVTDWTVPGLSALQRLLSVRLIAQQQARAHAETQPASDLHPSSFHAMSRLQVNDISESEFLRAAGRLYEVANDADAGAHPEADTPGTSASSG